MINNHHVTLSIGSNSSDKHHQMSDALTWAAELLSDVIVTPVCTSSPMSGIGEPYLNAVVTGKTSASADEINLLAKGYEKSRGRIKGASSVVIDIDVVCYDGVVLRPKDYDAPYYKACIEALTNNKTP